MTRLPVACSHRPPCPGCPRFGETGIDRGAFGALASIAERAGLATPKVIQGPPVGFRHRARLMVRGRAQSPKVGIFEEGSHRVVHIPSCAVHHPLVNEVTAVVRRCLVECGISPYSEAAHLGDVRSLQVVVERGSQTAQVVVTTRADQPTGLDSFFALVTDRLGSRLHSLWWNGQPERTNAILGPRFQHVAGAPTVVEKLDGIHVHFPPGAFGQSNLPLFEELARRARSFVPDGSRVLELYAGTGSLGLPLAHRVDTLAANELGASSLEGLALGIAGLEPEVRGRITVHPGRAGDAAALIADADVVIADPPRKGLDAEVLTALSNEPPARFIYVSCGLESFLRESEGLLQSGRLKLGALEIFALFPNTAHVETLAVFERA